MWSVILGYINKPDLTSELILCMRVWVLEYALVCTWIYTHTQTHTVAGLCGGTSVGWPFQMAPGCASLSSNSTPQPQSFSSPPPSQSPGSAPTPYSLQIASPSHLSQPIINYWWMGRLTRQRETARGRERRGKSRPEGEKEEVRRAQQTVITLTNWLHLYDTVCVYVVVGGRETDSCRRSKIIGQKENKSSYTSYWSEEIYQYKINTEMWEDLIWELSYGNIVTVKYCLNLVLNAAIQWSDTIF